MAASLQVLLLEDVEGLGRAGDIVTAAEGHARNFLFPNGLAALATEHVQEKVATQAAQERKRKEQELQELQEISERLEGTELTIEAKVKQGEDLFGSISTKQVVDELNKQAKLSLEYKQLQSKKPIKKAGDHRIAVSLSSEIEFTFILHVVPDAESKERLSKTDEE